MCYHTLYLFALCGHTSTSPRPIRNTPPCPHAHSQVHRPDRRSKHASLAESPVTPADALACETSFPSPQEFEFAERKYESVPCSPIVGGMGVDEAVIGGEGSGSVWVGSTASIMTGNSTGMASGWSCPVVIRHARHTFKIMDLCPRCQCVRVTRTARFEAQMIRESVEREDGSMGVGRGRGAVVDVARKRIKRQSAQKGKLIPLICVEENRIRREDEERGLIDGGVDGDVDVEDKENEEVAALLSDVLADANEIMAGKEKVSKKDWHARNASIISTVSTATTSGWSSWWGGDGSTAATTPERLPSKTAAQPTRFVEVQDLEALNNANANSLRRKKSSAQAPLSPGGMSPRWSTMQEKWRGINENVTRDVFGRNARGMDQIMGFGIAGSEDSVDA